MVKERYNLFIEDVLGGGDTYEEFEYSYDLKQLLPLSLRDKKFLLRTSFHSTNTWSTEIHAGVRVSLNLPSSATNRQITPSEFVPVGVATPLVVNADKGSDTEFGYYMNESQCYPVVVDFPTDNIIKLRLDTYDTIGAGVGFALNLSFEPLA